MSHPHKERALEANSLCAHKFAFDLRQIDYLFNTNLTELIHPRLAHRTFKTGLERFNLNLLLNMQSHWFITKVLIELSRSHFLRTNSTCSVCLSADAADDYRYSESERKVIVELPCGHVFHEVCVMNWLKNLKPSDGTCPMCRAVTIPKEVWAVDIEAQALWLDSERHETAKEAARWLWFQVPAQDRTLSTSDVLEERYKYHGTMYTACLDGIDRIMRNAGITVPCRTRG